MKMVEWKVPIKDDFSKKKFNFWNKDRSYVLH